MNTATKSLNKQATMSERGNVEGISLSRVAIIFYFLKYPVFNKQKVKQTGNPYTGGKLQAFQKTQISIHLSYQNNY